MEPARYGETLRHVEDDLDPQSLVVKSPITVRFTLDVICNCLVVKPEASEAVVTAEARVCREGRRRKGKDQTQRKQCY